MTRAALSNAKKIWFYGLMAIAASRHLAVYATASRIYQPTVPCLPAAAAPGETEHRPTLAALVTVSLVWWLYQLTPLVHARGWTSVVVVKPSAPTARPTDALKAPRQSTHLNTTYRV
jgi:hypothetical protein